MLPSLDVEIRERVARYLAAEMPVSEFWDWFMPRTCYLSREADQNTAALAYDIQLLLFEFSGGLWTEPELRDKLRLLARDYQATVASSSLTEAPTTQTGSIKILRRWGVGLRHRSCSQAILPHGALIDDGREGQRLVAGVDA